MNDNLPLVSVALHSYNQKDWLVECIESILAQDYPNMEIVVADDGSTDGSQDVLREYEKKYSDKFVLCFSDKNRGIADNCNMALSNCKGKYMAHFDGDDVMLPGKISKQVAFMEQNPDCVICYHNMEVFNSDTGDRLGLYYNKKRSMDGDVRMVLKYGSLIGTSMFRADGLPKHGFNLNLPGEPGWLFMIETLANGGTVNYIDEVLGIYRRHSSNASAPSEYVSQNDLDSLNTCNIVIAKYPHLFSEAMYVYSMRLYKLRKKKEINYRSALMSSLKLRFRLSVFLRLFAHISSFGFLKL